MVIVTHPDIYEQREKRERIDLFVSLIDGAVRASQHVMVVANVPKRLESEVAQILKGLKGATVAPLSGRDDFCSMTAVVREDQRIETIIRLRNLGVHDIIVNTNLSSIMGME